MTESTPVLRSAAENLHARFFEFGQTQDAVVSMVQRHEPQEIASMSESEKQRLVAQIMVDVPEDYRGRLIQRPIQEYLQRETAIQAWIDANGSKQGLENQTVQDTLLKIFENPAVAQVEGRPQILAAERIHDGVAITVSPVDFRRLVVNRLISAGKQVEDGNEIDAILARQRQLGFTLDPSALPSELGLPEGMKVVVIGQNAESVQTLEHEKREILAMDMRQTQEARLLRKLADRSGMETKDSDSVAEALSDLAARVEEGRCPATIGRLGITPEYAKTNPDEAKLVKAILKKVGEMNFDQEQVRIEAARLVRGGLAVPSNLLIELVGEREAEQQLETTKIKDEEDFDFVLSSRLEGSFTSSTQSLRTGEPLGFQGRSYIVTGIMGQGGEGTTYRARLSTAAGKDTHVIKEAHAPLSSLYANPPLVAASLIDPLMDQYIYDRNPGAPSPDMQVQQRLPYLLNDIKNFANSLNFYSPSLGTANLVIEYTTRMSNILDQRIGHIRIGGTVPVRTPGSNTLDILFFDKATTSSLTPDQRAEIVRGLMTSARQAYQETIDSPIGQAAVATLNEARNRLTREAEMLHAVGGINGVEEIVGIRRPDTRDPLDPKFDCDYLIKVIMEGDDVITSVGLEKKPQSLWDQRVTVKYMRDFLAMMHSVHERGVVHRDINYSNVRVRPINGNIRPGILDFGNANRIGTTPNKERMWSYGFSAPEIADLTQPADIRSDIYASGMLCFSLLTGVDVRDDSIIPGTPVEAGRKLAIVADIMRQRNVSEDLVAVVLKSIAVDPKDRFQTDQEMSEALNKARLTTTEVISGTIDTDPRISNLYRVFTEGTYQGPYQSRYPNGVRKGRYIGDDGREHLLDPQDRSIEPWPQALRDYVGEIVRIAEAQPDQRTAMLERLAQLAIYRNQRGQNLGNIPYLAARDTMIGILQEAHNRGEPVDESMMLQVDGILRLGERLRNIEGADAYYTLLVNVAQRDPTRMADMLQRCLRFRDVDQQGATNGMVQILRNCQASGVALDEGSIRQVDEIIRSMTYPKNTVFYARYPQGGRPKGGYIDDSSQQGRSHTLDRLDPPLQAWPQEIAIFIDILRSGARDHGQGVLVEELVGQWREWKGPNAWFWNRLGENWQY
ncbi:MAG: protein kinase [Patescibacteria group bacterium]